MGESALNLAEVLSLLTSLIQLVISPVQWVICLIRPPRLEVEGDKKSSTVYLTVRVINSRRCPKLTVIDFSLQRCDGLRFELLEAKGFFNRSNPLVVPSSEVAVTKLQFRPIKGLN